ncbi:hypothetical protein JCM14469_05200 [Desulfatiferula olefinivorans]
MDEVAIVFEYLKKNKPGIMFDVGAHHGKTSLPFLESGWQVHAFEPDPDNYKILAESLGIFDTFHPENCAVSDASAESSPFFTSSLSSGISSLCSFHETHTLRCETKTVTLSEYCNASNIEHIDFLKIDTEGYDLFVLRGIDWDRIHPSVIVCEFEDAKTACLDYTFNDLAGLLASKGYELYISEWYPVVQYGAKHTWRCFHTWPCRLHDHRGWGNIIAFSDGVDALAFTNAAVSYAAQQEKLARRQIHSPHFLSQRSVKNGHRLVQQLADSHIRKKWPDLPVHQGIKQVLLAGVGGWIKHLSMITHELPGPTIRGILDYKAEYKEETYEGLPVFSLDEIDGLGVDALLLPSRLVQNIDAGECLETLAPGVPVIDLFEDFPKIPYLQLIRDLMMASGNLKGAAETASLVLSLSSEKQDYETFYHMGIEFHKEKQFDQALPIYERIARDEKTGVDLKAWAHFKTGELLLEKGQGAEAQACFERALRLNPFHTKAQIFCTPQDRPLRVCLSQDASRVETGCIHVPMEADNEALWGYYFTYRKPDYISLIVPGRGREDNVLKIMSLIAHHCAKNGVVSITTDDDTSEHWCRETTAHAARLFKLDFTLSVNDRRLSKPDWS